MCDIRTFTQIERAVETKMMAGQMFTAFDITLTLQNKRVRKAHREIRRDIRKVADQLMWRYGYERTMVHLTRVKASAFVYHPRGTDGRSHSPSMPRQIPAVSNRPTRVFFSRTGSA